MKILIPTPLRQYAAKKATVEVSAKTVGEALNVLTSGHPELRRHLFTEEGKLRAFVNVYLNDEDVRYLQKEGTPIGETDTLSIVPSIAGGSSKPFGNGDLGFGN
ncbi:MAG: MoaD/ThiS family protein [Terriglobales bacterium]|jgi:molybdopterin converting factor small subunit